MEAVTNQKFVHRSPRKLRLVADMVRAIEPNKALEILSFTQNYGAKDLSAAIKTALANARQSGLTDRAIYFKSIEINGAAMMKRMRPGTRGRAKPYARRMSHIKIVLSDDKLINEQSSRLGTKEISSKEAVRGGMNKGAKTSHSAASRTSDLASDKAEHGDVERTKTKRKPRKVGK